MAFLNRVRNICNYFSPQKAQPRREKPYSFKVSDIPGRAKTHHKRQVKPEESVLEHYESNVEVWSSLTPNPGSDVDATLLPPSPPTSALELYNDSLEGDTLVLKSLSEVEAGSSEYEWNANEDTLVVDDGTYMEQSKAIDLEEQRRWRAQQGRELRNTGWSEDAVFLFQKLGMRGLEPLLPVEWFDDFSTLSDILFTANIDKAFIRPAGRSFYQAQRALGNLFDLGGRVRDSLLTRARVRTPAYQIGRAVNKYRNWAMKDGGVDALWAELPLFEIVTFGREVATSTAERDMICKLGTLHDQWSKALQTESMGPEVPTLYGVTASHTIMAFASYVPPTAENETPHLRLVAMFDFGKDGFDVWNALAIAIFVVHCRNRMMQLGDCLPQPDYCTEDDPDL